MTFVGSDDVLTSSDYPQPSALAAGSIDEVFIIKSRSDNELCTAAKQSTGVSRRKRSIVIPSTDSGLSLNTSLPVLKNDSL